MSHKDAIARVISRLRARIQEKGCLDSLIINEQSAALAGIGYQYDSLLFPALPADFPWGVERNESPRTLAEALLWKMGKWKVYQSFIEHYANSDSLPKKTDVVFYAFAKHLGDTDKPIYDQHALRSMWAIDSRLSQQYAAACRSLLAKRNGEWKQVASGVDSHQGYLIYVERVLLLAGGDVSLGEIDKLLMPLGQAIKDNTSGVAEFLTLVGLDA